MQGKRNADVVACLDGDDNTRARGRRPNAIIPQARVAQVAKEWKADGLEVWTVESLLDGKRYLAAYRQGVPYKGKPQKVMVHCREICDSAAPVRAGDDAAQRGTRGEYDAKKTIEVGGTRLHRRSSTAGGIK